VKHIGIVLGLALLGIASGARGDIGGREEVSYLSFYPSGALKTYFGSGPHGGISWTHRLTQPPSLGLGRTLFLDYANTGGNNSRNFLTGGLGVQSATSLGTEGTTLNLGAGVGYYGTYISNGVFDPGKQNGLLVRLTAGLQLRGNLIVEGGYYKALRESGGLEGTALKIGVRF